MHFGLGERTGNTEHPAALVGADADHREHGGVAHHATLSDFLIARVEEQVADLAQRPVAPGIQLPIQELGGAADLARRQALQPNSRITASASRVETPLIYISATASMTARQERRPRSRAWG